MDAVTNKCVTDVVIADRIDVAKPLKKDCPYEIPAPFPFLRIFVQRNVIDAILADGKAAGGNEIGALLVGLPFEDEAGPYLIIEGRIPARHTAAGAGHVTFTAETWTDALDEREKHFPESKIVGWAHTHPSYGVFMSGHDLFIHRSFFDVPWLTAYVVDPNAEADGFFAWKDGEIRPVDRHYILEGDAFFREAPFVGDPTLSGDSVAGSSGGETMLMELKSLQEGLRFLDRRTRRLERLVRIMAPVVGLLLVVALILVLDRYPIVKELRRIVGAETQAPHERSPASQYWMRPPSPRP